MKRVDLIRYIFKQGCVFIREGGNHSVFFNPQFRKISTVPRHNEINDFLVKKICKDLGIPPTKK
ncbi:MAG: addiction module toxin, HicA family [Candidatus Doudnabacteria bacterium RIFCSPLOWO2_01_FULL_44_21]|uniref:Addiction module toxin, HicA family n=1 Tax=Candidatus Doudnabacteria bacterium RIFCSPLOWO2_01_FULL_44_21 TaxID=1817841 RepID=A0A1F5PYC2_9BACT|nr:MAG: addiction module toxin, HicA family [Candidatus Doudnabacteria bacterium RIFCSPHIGHO2_02_FULL_43_13b]OGE94712.1 MAG: addiction module toxin, HicA family [Candidatus Doudnabacteria bacterium RIFCSPLOWO2_01_FULL_44_21]